MQTEGFLEKHDYLFIHLTTEFSELKLFICLLRSALYCTTVLRGFKLACFHFCKYS